MRSSAYPTALEDSVLQVEFCTRKIQSRQVNPPYFCAQSITNRVGYRLLRDQNFRSIEINAGFVER